MFPIKYIQLFMPSFFRIFIIGWLYETRRNNSSVKNPYIPISTYCANYWGLFIQAKYFFLPLLFLSQPFFFIFSWSQSILNHEWLAIFINWSLKIFVPHPVKSFWQQQSLSFPLLLPRFIKVFLFSKLKSYK